MILAEASAWMTAETTATHDCGDHTIFVAHIRFMEADQRPPLIYHAGRYAALVPTREAALPGPEFSQEYCLPLPASAGKRHHCSSLRSTTSSGVLI